MEVSGKQERHDIYNGILPKGRNICFIMREAYKETPKFYMLESEFDDPVTHQSKVLSGHMLKGSHNRKYFHSPVYAVRVPADKDVERNILRCEDVSAHVMHELDAWREGTATAPSLPAQPRPESPAFAGRCLSSAGASVSRALVGQKRGQLPVLVPALLVGGSRRRRKSSIWSASLLPCAFEFDG